ncbi:ATP-dependent DNA helicase sgs1 [Puccinia graminis f. sp. tritici]|uniref:DNA 3'-5' helicase n=1 Tax=Puccinia graminis f. sp. tritici TaxID=56615 RepID=A0A5B0RLI3_PUCGR|nr:ATP-dependent DNA helicase sgs1 [Puccinia graminis f. sp. tritici]KAA1076590.1 ATP-dependent DNA helicase sgs1 [Puccinia graminis f. sp. tritici]KAA1090497.1 ATP-dependent DNA helicase sgs1 [Puccinia graminis f. sp. tritici]KAA1126756.1 ATP-dependent DNA helicase sgs1 [Puccinia graminis f. sp. tritici]
MLRHLPTPAIRAPHRTNGRIQLLAKIATKENAALKSAIGKMAQLRYGQPAKELQIEAVYNLAKGTNTFVLAGTGFGKSRIPEIYHTLHPKPSNAVIIVLNPLDALGDNQVLEKIQAGFTAINLTKMTFNEEEANNIVNGVYNFVYLSPEIFLNSPLWDQVYFCANFQDRLALVVVDEAHIIYQWGLVESGSGQHKRTLIGRLEDLGIFRPSYGKLGSRLLTRNSKPILLMSATCRPAAVAAIKTSLKLEDHNLQMVAGELTRPEIRIIRRPIATSVNSGLDLLEIFAPKAKVPDASVVPTLIYSGTRNRTKHVMKALDVARGTPGNSSRPNSTFVRRFHSCTGDKDKLKLVEAFANKQLPVVSCTMALGMGQNWSRVRFVIQMGRSDPSAICQMIGRAGRDGKPGLAIVYVEPNRDGGKNCLEDFDGCDKQTDEDRMDALAITPVCLRIAFAIDNGLGYVPLSTKDPSYIQEQKREIKEGFVKCLCSNCEPLMAEGLIENIKDMTIDNVDDFIQREWPVRCVTTTPVIKRKQAGGNGTSHMKRIKLSLPMQSILSERLNTTFGRLFDARYPKGSLMSATDLFGPDDIAFIVKKFGKIDGPGGLRKVIGGQMLDGQAEALYACILEFMQGPLAEETNEKKNQAALARKEKKLKTDAVRAAKLAVEAEEARIAKAKQEELKRKEREKAEERKRLEDNRKAEERAHLAVLVRLAGEEAERRGVASIHRGR